MKTVAVPDLLDPVGSGVATTSNPLTKYPAPPYPQKKLEGRGTESEMDPRPDYGVESYKGSGKLEGKTAIITGGDSGIGRAVALAYAREGADVVISYLDEDSDAKETQRMIEDSGRKAVLVGGDIQEQAHCQRIVREAVDAFGKVDVLVNNAAFQMTRASLDEIPDGEFEKTYRTNIFAMYYLVKAAVPHMPPGGSIINTTSIQADSPGQELFAYASTKAAIQNFTGGLAKLLGEKGIRVNCVAPGPIWTPLIPSTLPEEEVQNFGAGVPLKRPGQPVELAPAYVLLASDEASYMSGATIAVTGGTPFL